jgi:hypothetical protein
MLDVQRRDSAVACVSKSRRRVIAFTNVLKLVSNRKGIDARAWRYMSLPKPTEGSRTVPIGSDARWQTGACIPKSLEHVYRAEFLEPDGTSIARISISVMTKICTIVHMVG